MLLEQQVQVLTEEKRQIELDSVVYFVVQTSLTTNPARDRESITYSSLQDMELYHQLNVRDSCLQYLA